ncbi:MAG TPA: carboxypeptidase-like regulatory domain-containing protein, partial [Polyangia bacterium]
MSRRLWFALAAVAVAFAPTAGRAEVAGFPASAEVRGQIVDEAGGPVFGADVIVARPDGSARRAAISDAQGRFTVSGGEAGRVVVTVIAGRGARVATETLDLAPGATALLRVRDDAGKGTLAVTSAETELPGQVLAADCIQQTGAKTPALSRQGDVAGALAALPEAGPATAPAGAPVLAGLPLSEVAVSFEGFSLSDPIDGDVPAELPLSVLGAVAVEAGPVPSVALRAPTIERKQTALSGGLALARGARGADDLARPRGVTGGWDFALRRDSTGRWGRGTVAFSPRHQIWEADPTSVRAARGRKQRTIPLLLWGESELAGWHVRGGLLGLLTTRHYGRGGHVLASGDPIDGVAHQRNWGLVGVNAGRDIGRGDHVGLSLGVLRTTREESLAALPAHESTGTTVSGATNVTVSGSLAGEHRLNGGLGFTLSTGERTGLSASRQPGLLLTDATARVFRPYLALSERYAPSLHLEVEAGFGLALASFSGSSKVEGGATLERSFRGRLWFAPHGRLSVRPLVGPSVLGIHVMAARTPGKLPLLALMDATSGPRVELPLPAQDALALAADLSTRRLHLRLMAQTRRDATVLEDRFAAATGQP